jgi:hypothetical protein
LFKKKKKESSTLVVLLVFSPALNGCNTRALQARNGGNGRATSRMICSRVNAKLFDIS